MSIQSTKTRLDLFVEISTAQQQFLIGGGDVNAGPIWNNDDAKVKCPRTCDSVGLQWNGNWFTNDPGKNSVCGCVSK